MPQALTQLLIVSGSCQHPMTLQEAGPLHFKRLLSIHSDQASRLLQVGYTAQLCSQMGNISAMLLMRNAVEASHRAKWWTAESPLLAAVKHLLGDEMAALNDPSSLCSQGEVRR